MTAPAYDLPCEEGSPAAVGKSARTVSNIITFPVRQTIGQAQAAAREDASEVLRVAFGKDKFGVPLSSEDAICENACRRLQCPDSGKIRRHLRKEVQKPDYVLVRAAISHIRNPSDLPRVQSLLAFFTSGGSA